MLSSYASCSSLSAFRAEIIRFISPLFVKVTVTYETPVKNLLYAKAPKIAKFKKILY
jgi:hypothetical protein